MNCRPKGLNIKFQSLSIKVFLAMVMLLIVTISLISYIWYINASSSLERNAKEYLASGVETINSQLDSFLRMINSTANNIAYGYPQYRYVITNGPYKDLGVYMEQVRQIEKNILKNIFAFSDNLDGVSIVSRSGYMFKAGYPTISSDAIEYPFVKKAMTGEYRVVYIRHNRKVNPTPNSEALTMAVPIRFREEVAGVVLMDLNYKHILDIYSLQIKKLNSTGSGMRIVSVLPDGQILYDSNDYMDAQASVGYAGTKVADFFSLGTGPSFSGALNIKGREYLVVRMRAEYTGITTAGIIPIADLRSEINSGFTWTLAGVVLIFLVAMITAYMVTLETMKNLSALRRTMLRVGKDGVGIRAELEGNDEIVDLANTFNLMMQRVEDLMHRISQEEKALHRMQLDVFRSQINPHFLYNTLITIRHLAKLRGVRNIDEVAMSLSKILRFSMDRASEFSTIAEDIEMLENYLNIQKFRYTEDITLSCSVEPGLENAMLPKMILQPLVENALFHGYADGKKDKNIQITAEKENQDMLIHIRDQGKGISEDEIEELLNLSESDGVDPDGHVHVGIRNVHRRLQLYYGSDYGLSIKSSQGHFTIVTVRVPLQFKEGSQA